eukprot:3295948-Pyramimonas_sp.AAC.1
MQHARARVICFARAPLGAQLGRRVPSRGRGPVCFVGDASDVASIALAATHARGRQPHAQNYNR